MAGEAYVQRDSGLAFMRAHRQLRALAGDPRWQPFLRKMGFSE